MAVAIERGSGIPLYLQIRERIVDLISERGLRPGDALPSEPELQATFQVSRATIRHTLGVLEREGIIERQQGKGTFVALPRLQRALPELTSFSEHLDAQGLRSASRLVEFGAPDADAPRRPVSPDEPDAGLFPADEGVVRFVRVRLANDVPVGIHTTLTPTDVAQTIGLSAKRIAGDPHFSFYRALEESGRQLNWAEEHLVARGTSKREAQLLGMALGAPVMSVLRLTRDGSGRLVEAVRAVYLGDKYDYVIHLERRALSTKPG
ncbi:MAG: GntR family transcriptional regulator [Candidatus Limnocylindria bacterium]